MRAAVARILVETLERIGPALSEAGRRAAPRTRRRDGSGCSRNETARRRQRSASVLEVALEPARMCLLEPRELAVCFRDLALRAQLLDVGVPGLGRLLEGGGLINVVAYGVCGDLRAARLARRLRRSPRWRLRLPVAATLPRFSAFSSAAAAGCFGRSNTTCGSPAAADSCGSSMASLSSRSGPPTFGPAPAESAASFGIQIAIRIRFGLIAGLILPFPGGGQAKRPRAVLPSLLRDR